MAEDKKNELEKHIQEYDGQHDQWLRRIMFFLGRRQAKLNNVIGRWLVKNITTKFAAWAVIKFKLFGVERKENMSLLDIALNWLKPSIFFRIPTEIESATEERVVVLRPECTVGFCKPGHQKICRASMNMDMQIIKKLGGKLTVTETILEGAKKCRHIIEKDTKP